MCLLNKIIEDSPTLQFIGSHKNVFAKKVNLDTEI